jgi:membrane-bound lytic murein transglycosylase B
MMDKKIIQLCFLAGCILTTFPISMFFNGCSSLDPESAYRLKLLDGVMQGVNPAFRPAAIKMINKGVDTAYIGSVLRSPKTTFLEKMVKINVTGFIKKADYSHNYNEQSLTATRAFYRDNAEALNATFQKTGVPGEVVTSILWVETKFGKITGNNHVLSVYASLASADELGYIEMNKKSYRATIQNSDSLDLLDSIVEVRAKRKANWAVDELIALRDMQTRLPFSIYDLNGSWAGAFGWSQFIPSSYMSWAVDGDGDGKVDLYNKSDAIASIGNYLKVNGWGQARADQEKAVFHYNNSQDYVNCVLLLADKIKQAN